MSLGQLYSQRTGYAVHALCYMAKKPFGKLTTAPELAEWMKKIWSTTSHTYLSNVIQRLARGGVLQSHRGVLGGYSLTRPATEITLRDVVTLLEGVTPVRCGLAVSNECPTEANCGIKRVLWNLEESYLELLSQTSVADLANEIEILMPPAKSTQEAAKEAT